MHHRPCSRRKIRVTRSSWIIARPSAGFLNLIVSRRTTYARSCPTYRATLLMRSHSTGVLRRNPIPSLAHLRPAPGDRTDQAPGQRDVFALGPQRLERARVRHARIGGRRSIRIKAEWIDAWLERHARGSVTRPPPPNPTARDSLRVNKSEGWLGGRDSKPERRVFLTW